MTRKEPKEAIKIRDRLPFSYCKFCGHNRMWIKGRECTRCGREQRK